MTDAPAIRFILFRRRGKFKLAACRGRSKGCNVAEKQREKLGPCTDCFVIDNEQMTLAEVLAKLNKGDA